MLVLVWNPCDWWMKIMVRFFLWEWVVEIFVFYCCSILPFCLVLWRCVCFLKEIVNKKYNKGKKKLDIFWTYGLKVRYFMHFSDIFITHIFVGLKMLIGVYWIIIINQALVLTCISHSKLLVRLILNERCISI